MGSIRDGGNSVHLTRSCSPDLGPTQIQLCNISFRVLFFSLTGVFFFAMMSTNYPHNSHNSTCMLSGAKYGMQLQPSIFLRGAFFGRIVSHSAARAHRRGSYVRKLQRKLDEAEYVLPKVGVACWICVLWCYCVQIRKPAETGPVWAHVPPQVTPFTWFSHLQIKTGTGTPLRAFFSSCLCGSIKAGAALVLC